MIIVIQSNLFNRVNTYLVCHGDVGAPVQRFCNLYLLRCPCSCVVCKHYYAYIHELTVSICCALLPFFSVYHNNITVSETEKIMTCICGKRRGKLNSTNWKRHLDNCN